MGAQQAPLRAVPVLSRAPTDRELLGDLREALHRITAYIAGTAYESFVEDTKTQDAVIRNLEVLGEAPKNLSAALRSKHPDVGRIWPAFATA